MDNMINVYLFGKKYQVPAGLTIMTAMEYAGYELVRGCGCRNGFCSIPEYKPLYKRYSRYKHKFQDKAAS